MSKLKEIIKKITDNDLNTIPGLTTVNYLFELIGLKDKVDLRKFSRNFIKADELIKNINDNKLDKGNYQKTAQDLKNEIDTKANKSGDTFTGDLKILDSDFIVDGRCRFYGGTELQFINSESDTTGISFFRGKGGDRGDTTNFYKYH
ncbi:hypothetical protein, partial [Cetobacterium sp.]|uniref:hypothetical protein n=1 Tax=Cetobacterium sp. TaxID=2071632 RepID=UPI003EE54BA7